jgi:hypothetical protein
LVVAAVLDAGTEVEAGVDAGVDDGVPAGGVTDELDPRLSFL